MFESATIFLVFILQLIFSVFKIMILKLHCCILIFAFYIIHNCIVIYKKNNKVLHRVHNK